ncbi:MAG: extracellular solute-binding protein [Deltaproteobacteria bacterium]|nr:extracellular solute-binding protein [Deltaproteobacteria bacterium]
MQVFVIFCLTAILALASGAPAPAISAEGAAWQKVVEAAQREGVVNYYSYPFTGTAGVQVTKAFKDKYGVQLEITTGRVPIMVERVRMEQKSKSYVADAFDASGAGIITLKNDGLLESVAEALPVLKEKDKFVRSPIEDPPEAQLLTVMRTHNGFWINTNLVKPEQEPKSFYDLLDPKWKGKMFLNNPLYASAPDSNMMVFVRAKVLAEDYFIKLYKSAALGGPGGSREAVDKLVRGEFAIVGPVSAVDAMRPFLGGAPIKPLDLKEGTMFRVTRWAATKNGPHPNATKVFINWLLSKEGQLVATKALGLDGVRNDIPSVMPFRFTGPLLIETSELVLLSDKHYSEQYLAKLLGLKR